jgi:flagellar protein FlaJ
MYERLIHFFSRIGLKYFGNYTKSLKELVEKSNLPIIYEKYLGQLFFYSSLSFFVFLLYFFYLFLFFWKFDLLISFISALTLSTTITFLVATVFYFYPFYRYSKQLKDIERNLPLGVSYMSIISKSGVPPEKMFEYVSEEKEFGEFAKECERIHKYVNLIGKDITLGIREVASRTPSQKFRNFLEGFISTILSGGDLDLYLSGEARKGISLYKEKQKKFTSVMSFFSDVFVVALLIAPLVLVIILTSFSLVESRFLGIEINYLASLTTYLFLPLFGVAFLIILHKVKI